MCDENKTIRTKNTDAPWALSLGNTELLVRLLKHRQRQSCQARCRSEGVWSSVLQLGRSEDSGSKVCGGDFYVRLMSSNLIYSICALSKTAKNIWSCFIIQDTIKWCRKEREFSFSSPLHEATCSRPPLKKMLCFTTMQMVFSLSFPLNVKRSYLFALLFAILAPGAAFCLATFYCLQRSETSSIPS